MDRRAAQFIGRDVLTQHAFDDTRPCQTKKRIFGLDEEAPLTWQITATAGVKAKHAHDAGHDATDLSQRGKSIGIAIEATDTCGYVRASGIIKTD